MKSASRGRSWLILAGLGILATLTVWGSPVGNVPAISGFTPELGTNGALITITGSNFSPVAAGNIVYFGAVQAVVSSASLTNLVVAVPAGATFAPITETVGGLTAASLTPFLPVFAGSGSTTSGALGPQTTLNLGTAVGLLTIADLDGDGKPDLIVLSGAPMAFLYQNISTNGSLSASSFAPPVILPLLPGGNYGNVVAVTATGDGKLDLVIADDVNSVVTVYQNLSTPGSLTTNSFGPLLTFPSGPIATGVAVGDIDGDGKPEIVTANGGDGNISVLLNQSTPGILTTDSFAPAVEFAAGNLPRYVAIADVDGDGQPDVLTVNNGDTGAFSVLRNVSTPGSIAFETNVVFTGLAGSYAIAVGDLDGDGKPDVVIGVQNSQAVSVFRNTSTPGSITSNSFAPPVNFYANGWINWVAIADMDGDGKPDVVASGQMPDELLIYKNISTPGSFTSSSLAAPVIFGTGWNPTSVAAGDLDGDGRPDLVIGNCYGETVSVYQNLVPFYGEGPPNITVQPASQTVTNGVSVNIGLDVTGDDLSYQWLFDGVPIGAGNIITTVAGNSSLGGTYAGDGGAATNAGFHYPCWAAVDGADNLYIVDGQNSVIRKVNPSGIITTVAGNNSLGGTYSGDGSAATNAGMYYPNSIAVDSAGNLYIADTHNNVIRKVDTNGIITTVAGNYSLGGGYSGDGGAATNAALNYPVAVTVDGAGNLYIAEQFNNVIRKVDAGGTISTVAGNQSLGGNDLGDGGAATNAGLNVPAGIAVDGAGNLFISEIGRSLVRKVDAGGTITTVAGNLNLGVGYSGDGGAATNATLNYPDGIATDNAGNLYIAEYGNNVIRKVDVNGTISTVAGNQSLGGGYSGDGGAATNAALNTPGDVTADGAGNLYIADAGNSVVREVAAAGFNVNSTNGTLTMTDAQVGRSGNYQVIVSNPDGSTTSSIVNLVVYGPPVITTPPASQTVNAGDSVTFNVSAVGTPPVQYQWSFNGTNLDGATSACLSLTDVQAGQAGDYAVEVITPAGDITSSNATLTVITPPVITTVQPANQVVTNGINVNIGVTATGTDMSYQWLFNGVPLLPNNIITTVAGNNSLGGTYAGDGGAATNAGMNYPSGVAVDGAGNLYISDGQNSVIRKVNPSGIITTVAGNNSLGGTYSGDGGAATNAGFYYTDDVLVDGAGNLYIADYGNNVIRKVDTNGIITTVAGNNNLGGGYSGDGGAATNAAINNPSSLALDGSGNLYFSDYHNNVVREVNVSGVITTVAGNFSLGGSWSGDGGAATNAGLSGPNAVTVDGAGNLYFTEDANNDVRKVDASGVITTVAGNPALGGGYSGDGGAATNAALNHPTGVTADRAGDLYIAEYGNNVVRKVDASGTITTVAGNYSLGGGYSGDGGAATNATLNNPTGLAQDGGGNLYVADSHNNVVREVAAAGFSVNRTNGALTISDVGAGLSGNYQVLVSNPAGSVTSSVVHLVVYAPPVITAQPVGQTVVAGGGVALNVGVVGTPPVKYQWSLNGAKISGATNALLTLTNIHVSQGGEYAVKITTPAGNITSSNALVTVIPVTILVYNASGVENYAAGSQSASYGYSGQLFYLPSGTNGTIISWGVVSGKRQYWMEDFSGYTLYTIAGAGKQTFMVLDQQGQGVDFNGNPYFWSAVFQGANAALAIATRQTYSFPATFAGMMTEVYPDPELGNPILDESSLSFSFQAKATQTANNTGQTTADLENALIKTLTAQGYKLIY